MEIEFLFILFTEFINNFLIRARAESYHSKGLSFTPCEECRAMSERKNINFTSDISYIIHTSAVNACIGFEDLFLN